MFAEVGFRLAGGDNPLILIPARVNDRGPYEFILDTGAGTSLLSPRLADALGIASTDTREGTGAAGRVTVALATADSLAVGDARREAMPIAITAEVDRIGGAVGARIDGDLGYDFLKHYRVSIDYQKQLVRLAQGAYEAAGAGARTRCEVGFNVAGPTKPLVVVPAFVNGQGPFSFALDTGASVTVLSPALAKALALDAGPATSMTGAGATLQASLTQVRSLAIGGAALEGVGVAVSDFLGSIGDVLGSRLDGVIGYNYLRRFRVTIDYPNALLSLVKAG